jgi:hypothetical protein
VIDVFYRAYDILSLGDSIRNQPTYELNSIDNNRGKEEKNCHRSLISDLRLPAHNGGLFLHYLHGQSGLGHDKSRTQQSYHWGSCLLICVKLGAKKGRHVDEALEEKEQEAWRAVHFYEDFWLLYWLSCDSAVSRLDWA